MLAIQAEYKINADTQEQATAFLNIILEGVKPKLEKTLQKEITYTTVLDVKEDGYSRDYNYLSEYKTTFLIEIDTTIDNELVNEKAIKKALSASQIVLN
ncbi:hypothetical protein ABEY43_06705 [Priestia megaterium]